MRESMRGKCRDMGGLIERAVDDVGRIITDLRPSILDHQGLWAALEWQAQEFIEATELRCDLRLAIPDGLRLIYLPPYTPELQPAEHLWHLVDEPIVNRHFDQLAEIQDCIEQRCRDLEAQPDALRDNTLFHWWPQPARPN